MKKGNPVKLPVPKHVIDHRRNVIQIPLTLSKRELPHQVNHSAMVRSVIYSVPVDRVIRILSIQEVRHVVSPGPVGIKGYTTDLPNRSHDKGIVVDGSIPAIYYRIDKLWIRPALRRKRYIAGLRFIDIEGVVHTTSTSAYVGDPKSCVPDLLLQGDVELLNVAIFHVRAGARNALRGNRSTPLGKWIRKREEWLSVLDLI